MFCNLNKIIDTLVTKILFESSELSRFFIEPFFEKKKHQILFFEGLPSSGNIDRTPPLDPIVDSLVGSPHSTRPRPTRCARKIDANSRDHSAQPAFARTRQKRHRQMHGYLSGDFLSLHMLIFYPPKYNIILFYFHFICDEAIFETYLSIKCNYSMIAASFLIYFIWL